MVVADWKSLCERLFGGPYPGIGYDKGWHTALFRANGKMKMANRNTELLLGAPIEADRFCDTNLGRSMDKIFDTGTQKIFS